MTRTGAYASSSTLDKGVDKSDYWNDGSVFSTSQANANDSRASASVGLGAGGSIKLVAAGMSGSGIVTAEARAAASWVDVIRVSGGTVPDKLRVTMAVGGDLGLSRAEAGVYQGSARVGLVMLNGTDPSGGDLPDAGQFAGYKVSEVWAGVQGSPYQDFFLTSNVENLQQNSDTAAIQWNAVFDLNYSSAHGGYIMNLYASATAIGYRGGSGVADFGHTIRLIGVTNTDGSALSGDIEFDSGFKLEELVEETPAPPAVLLAVLGVLSLAGGPIFRRLRGLPAEPQPV
ncbi:MAG: hypothetical protein ABGY75_15950 [Gemmataceae bacterium]